MRALSFPLAFNSIRTPWFADPACLAISSGFAYNARCVAAIGPKDFSRVVFVVTSNPRQKAGALGREIGADLIVQECAWSIGRTSARVHAEVVALLAAAQRPVVDGFVVIPRTHLRPLLIQAAEKAGVEAMLHAEFHAHALGVETEKLHASLLKGGSDPKVVAGYRYVSAAEAPATNRADWILPAEKVQKVKPSFARTRTMAQLYKSGRTLRSIAAQFNISHGRVKQILVEQAGLEMRPVGPRPLPSSEKAVV